MKRATALLCAVLMAVPAAAQPSEEGIAAFIAAVEEIGCRVETDAQAQAIEQATGFGDAKLAEIVALLLETGRAVIPATMEGFVLTTGGCA